MLVKVHVQRESRSDSSLAHAPQSAPKFFVCIGFSIGAWHYFGTILSNFFQFLQSVRVCLMFRYEGKTVTVGGVTYPGESFLRIKLHILCTIADGKIELTLPDKPTSPKQKYLRRMS